MHPHSGTLDKRNDDLKDAKFERCILKGFWYLLYTKFFGHDMNPYSLRMKM